VVTATDTRKRVERQRCFGAASRDPEKPCRNPRLDRQVVPTPGQALKAPNAPCHVVRRDVPFVCAFGAREGSERGRVALIGDSHATHWRAALAPIARRKRWVGYSLTRAGCPLSLAAPVLPQRLLPECHEWRRRTMAYLRARPSIHTLFVSQHRVRVVVPKGGSRLETEVAGYIGAWNALPPSVKRVIVIRDTPASPHGMGRCVLNAQRRGAAPGSACAYPRTAALEIDPAAVAARRMGSPRVRVVDMTRFFCDRTLCYPVIGGALVHKDTSHITAQYGATLAPYLHRRVSPLLG
jgi:hypothetical protein